MKVARCKLIMIKDKEMQYDNLKSAKDIFDFLTEKLELHKEPEEVVVMLALDNKNNVNGVFEVSRGTIDSTLLNPRNVYKRALVSNAKSIVIAHNHPAGSILPSKQDKMITASLKEAGEVLQVKLLDHLIITDKNYYSFYENNPDLISEEECEKFYCKEYKEKEEKDFERS